MTKTKTIGIRLPEDLEAALPPASLTGERSKFIREAIEEKIKREAKKGKKAK